MNHPNDQRLIAELTDLASRTDPDVIQTVTLRLLQLKASRSLLRAEPKSIGETWYHILDCKGIQKPVHYASRVAHRVSASTHSCASRDPRATVHQVDTLHEEPHHREATLDRVERQEAQRVVNQCMAALSEEEQRLLYRVFLEGTPLCEIAKEWGKSPSAVRGIWYRLRDRMKHMLSAQFGGTPLLN